MLPRGTIRTLVWQYRPYISHVRPGKGRLGRLVP